jgi:hypothetical protein
MAPHCPPFGTVESALPCPAPPRHPDLASPLTRAFPSTMETSGSHSFYPKFQAHGHGLRLGGLNRSWPQWSALGRMKNSPKGSIDLRITQNLAKGAGLLCLSGVYCLLRNLPFSRRLDGLCQPQTYNDIKAA